MKDKMIRILTIFLCLALCLSGCGAPAAPDGAPSAPMPASGADSTAADGLTATGKYIESDITPPLSDGQFLGKIGVWPDGTLYGLAYDGEGLELFTSADGGAAWERRPALRFEDVHPGGNVDAYRYDAAPDGSVYYAYRLKDTDDTGAHLYRAAPDGTGAEISVDALDEHNRLNEAMWLYALHLSGDGKLLLKAMVFPAGQEGYDSGSHTLFVIDPETGGCAREIVLSGASPYACGASGCYELGFDNQIMYYDYATGASQALGLLDTGAGDDLEKKLAMKMAVLDEETHSFALMSGEDLRIVAPGGALAEILCAGGYAFSDPRKGISQLFTLPDESFVARFTSDKADQVCRYAFDGDAPLLPPSGTMTIWALEDSEPLRGAITEFRALHPEQEVVLELGRTADGNSLPDNDIITALNTRLIAGNAPDVLILDGLPARGYIQKGALLDLSGLVDEGEYFANILNTWKTDGGTWAYPAFVKLSVLVTEPTLGLAPASLAELAEAAVQGPSVGRGYDPLPLEQQALMATNNGADLFDVLYPAASGAVFPDGASLDEAALREFYAALSAIAQKHGISDALESAVITIGTPISDMSIQFSSERSRAAVMTVIGFHSTVSAVAIRDATVKMMPGSPYMPTLNAAVPAKAAQPDLAKEFIREVLLGGEVQESPSSDGLPVSRSGLAAAQEVYAAGLRERAAAQPAEEFGISQPYLEKALAQDFAALMEQASLCSEQSVLLRDVVRGHAESLVRGESTVDEAVKKTEDDVRLYFAEQG